MNRLLLIPIIQLVSLMGVVMISPAAQITTLSCSLVGANIIRTNPDDTPTNMNSLDLMVRDKIERANYEGATQDILDCLEKGMYEIEHEGIKESVLFLIEQDINTDSKEELRALLPYL